MGAEGDRKPRYIIQGCAPARLSLYPSSVISLFTEEETYTTRTVRTRTAMRNGAC